MKIATMLVSLLSVVLAGVGNAAPADVDGRPYEFVWANRMKDDRPVLLAIENADGWKVAVQNAAATVKKTREHRLFGDGSMRLTYHGTGANPKITLRRSPVSVPKDADTLSLWVYGNRFQNNGGKPVPGLQIYARFKDAKGAEFEVRLGAASHPEWFLLQMRLTDEEQKRIAGGCEFIGFTFANGANEKDLYIDITSFAAYHEEFRPLTFKERAKRPNRVFPSVPAGVHTGAGELAFPNRVTGVIPPVVPTKVEYRLPKSNVNWDDLAMRVGDGKWRRFAVGSGVYSASVDGPVRRERDDVRVTWRVMGQSIVADVEGPNDIAEVRFGALADFADAETYTVPYWSYSMTTGTKRPWVAVFREGGEYYCAAATMDWTQSNGSEPWCEPMAFDGTPMLHGGVYYNERTDGKRNVCAERLVWSFAPALRDVLPMIPNPPSPYRSLTAGYQWCHMGAQTDRERDKAYWNDRHRRGLRQVFIGDHEVCMRDGNESFTYRTCAAPGKGGDAGMYHFTRHMIDKLGYLYGPYNNYTDFAPVNEYWHADNMIRKSDNNLLSAWYRCWSPKPTWAVEMCERIVPVLQGKFRFNSGYCDVHTCVSPWSKCDYDARVPGGGTFAATFYAYGELLMLQRKFWEGPVYSEGGVHYLYSGLDDGNFAQDQGYQIDCNAWLVDFDLERMHPLANNFGMGYPEMFYSCGKNFREKVPAWFDRFLAATVAFGHVGYFMTGNPEQEERGYWSILALQKTYAQEDVAEIRYGTRDGRLVATAEALATGEINRSQVAVTYRDGTRIFVNGSNYGEGFAFGMDGKRFGLTPNGWLGLTGDGKVCSVSDERGEACVGQEYVYVAGRGKRLATPFGTTKGQLVRLYEAGDDEEIFVRKDAEVELPYAARRIVRLDAVGAEAGAADYTVTNGVTRLRVKGDAVSYRATKPSGFCEAKATRLREVFERAEDWKMAEGAQARPLELPRAWVSGMAYRGGKETEIGRKTGADAHLCTTEKVGGESKRGIYMHPPWHGGVGYTFMRWRVKMPSEPQVFSVQVGKVDTSPGGDGTLYRIYVETEEGSELVAELHTNEHRWQTLRADLSRWAGRTIKLKLVSDCGAKDNVEADHSYWGDLKFEAKR